MGCKQPEKLICHSKTEQEESEREREGEKVNYQTTPKMEEEENASVYIKGTHLV